MCWGSHTYAVVFWVFFLAATAVNALKPAAVTPANTYRVLSPTPKAINLEAINIAARKIIRNDISNSRTLCGD